MRRRGPCSVIHLEVKEERDKHQCRNMGSVERTSTMAYLNSSTFKLRADLCTTEFCKQKRRLNVQTHVRVLAINTTVKEKQQQVPPYGFTYLQCLLTTLFETDLLIPIATNGNEMPQQLL